MDDKENVSADRGLDPEIENWFMYHNLTQEEQARCSAMREAAKALAYSIRANTPRSADQTVALRKLRECLMTANDSIACANLAPSVNANGSR